jgi:RNA polymerase sigma-70 factor, ECF subfamily
MPCDHTADDLATIDGLYSYALALSRNHGAAEELVQETYVRAMRALSRLRPGSNLRFWLFTILRNVWLNQLRKRARGPHFIRIEDHDGRLADGMADPSTHAHDIYVSKIDAKRVQDAIERISFATSQLNEARQLEDTKLAFARTLHAISVPLSSTRQQA